jgi:uncharacterized membrane protein YuzA (DUF378 family)
MNAAFQKIFISIALIFLLFILIYFFVMLSAVRQSAVTRAENYLQTITDSVSTSASEEAYTTRILGGSPSAAEGRLRVLLVYRPDRGIEELWSSSPEYLANLPDDLSRVRGNPNIAYNDIYEEKLELSLENGLTLIAVIHALNGADVAPILIQLLYFLLGFAAFTLLFMIIRIIVEPGKGESQGIEYGSSEQGAAGIDPLDNRAFDPGGEDPSQSRPAAKRSDIESELEEIPVAPEEPVISAGYEQAPSRKQSMTSNQRKSEQNDDTRFVAQENRIWPSELLKLRLNNEIERSAENESDIGFAVFRLGRRFVAEDGRLEEFEKLLLSFFRYEDLLFNLDGLFYGAILPSHGQEECLKHIEKFLIHCDERFKEPDGLFAGFSTRSGRLMGGERLMKEGVKAASMAGPRKGRIIGFKPDPQKYRAHLMGAPR